MVDRQPDSSLNRNDTDSVVGTWSPQWSIGDGMHTPRAQLRDVTLTFTDGRCAVRRGETIIRLGSYATDATKPQKSIEVCFTESDVAELIGVPLHGIYEVNKDQLRICYGPPGGHRARSFSAEKGTGQYLAEYRRCDGGANEHGDHRHCAGTAGRGEESGADGRRLPGGRTAAGNQLDRTRRQGFPARERSLGMNYVKVERRKRVVNEI